MAEHASADRRLAIRTTLLAASLLAALFVVLALRVDSASAIEIRTFGAQPSLTQAGGHPDLTIRYAGETRDQPTTDNPCQCNDPRNIEVHLPTGFIGNPPTLPRCKAADFARNHCPADSQVGSFSGLVSQTGGLALEIKNEPIYNLYPRPNQVGLLGVVVTPGLFNVPFYSVISARTDSDYGLDANNEGLERQFVVQKFTFILWGVPADDVHTPLRRSSAGVYDSVPSNSPRIPFLVNPGTCNESLSSSVEVIGYDGSIETASDPWPQTTGCDQLTFNPSLSARPTTTATDSASGVDIDLTVPQLLSPTFPSPSEIKAATVTLPVGFSINSNAADGKTSCSDQLGGFGTRDGARCPEYSKIGTDTISSPALPESISGGIYLGDPLPGNRYRIFLTADGYGTHIKLRGTVRPDPQTGQLVTSFNELPQSPLTEFNLHFFGAERGLLATPTQCGTYAVRSTFVPWDEVLASQSSTQFFTLDSGPNGAPCPPPVRPFHPGFAAAAKGNTAGSHSPFGISLTRDDGEQNLSGLSVTTPPGFVATLAGIPYCSEAALAIAAAESHSGLQELSDSACPAASQVGKSLAGAGAGSRPVFFGGRVYLAGPYKGAPLSLAVITPAVSGPYDLANVVVRAGIEVDRRTAQVKVVSDSLPQMLQGIPLRLRSVQVNLDRPNFSLNPTNCSPFAVRALVSGDQGGRADLSSHFQVADCASLPFGPKLALKLTGGTQRTALPVLDATLTAKAGEANIARVVVLTPHSLFLENSHINAPCTRVQYAADACPASAILGRARAFSPLLDRPLKGPVYLRSSSHKLPDIVADLRGQVDIELDGRIDSVHGRLRASFETPPDVPLRRFELHLLGGKKGLLVNSENLCASPQRAGVKMTGQNGKRISGQTVLNVPCGNKARHKRSASSKAKRTGR